MGTSHYSDDDYNARRAFQQSTGQSAMHYTDQVVNTLPPDQQKVHEKLNPKGVKMRESRDSDAHPASRAVAILFDETGSMGTAPRAFQQNIPKLMALLLRKGYITDPQILVGAIGDAQTDRAPLQIGQFESGLEMDDDMARFWLEGNGGGQMSESYDLAMYFMARHTSIDCYEKRGDLGYLFIIGDELCRETISKAEVERVIGDTIESDIPIDQIIDELQEKYEVFFIHVPTTGYGPHQVPTVSAAWKKLLPERVITLDDPTAVCEMVATQIGVHEGIIDVNGAVLDLQSAGTNASTAQKVANALVVTQPKGSIATVSGTGLTSSDTNRGVMSL